MGGVYILGCKKWRVIEGFGVVDYKVGIVFYEDFYGSSVMIELLNGGGGVGEGLRG